MSKAVTCPNCGEDISGDYISADPARRHFFAALRDAHANLRDDLRDRWPNPEVLRKHALIAIGHCDLMTVTCGSKKATVDVAAAFRHKDQYCIAIPKGDVVMIYTARSMARRALPKKEFLDVAGRVFTWVYEQTGIDPTRSMDGKAA